MIGLTSLLGAGKLVAGGSKIAVYASNILVGSAANAFGLDIANPIGAAAYGALDLAERASPKIRDHPVVRVAQGVGALGYLAKTAYNIYGMTRLMDGEVGAFTSGAVNIPFDLGLAVVLGTDAIHKFSKEGVDAIEDVKGIARGAKGKYDGMKDKFGRKKGTRGQPGQDNTGYDSTNEDPNGEGDSPDDPVRI